MKPVNLVMIAFILSLLALAGCQTTAGVTTSATTPAATSNAPATTTATTAPVTTTAAPVTTSPAPAKQTYTDDLGRSVEITGFPQRIISLSPSNTEVIYALGLEDRLIGVTTYCNYPEAAKSKPQVSEFSIVDIEKIVALEPDLILADDLHKSEVVPALEKLGVPVFVLRPGTMDQIFKDLEIVAKITGKTDAATPLVASLKQRVKTVTDKLSAQTNGKPRLLYVTWHDPIWTAGDNTIVGELFRSAGAVNIAGELDGYATISLETVIDKNPQIIVVMSSMGDQNTSLDYINSEPRLQATDALKNKQVFMIDSDIFGRTTPRMVDGLETMAKIVYPDLFK